MFKTRESTPRYYSNVSRDFQLLGHLFDCVISNVRQGVEGVSNAPFNKNIDGNLLTLVQSTLGLTITHKYSSQSLLAMCSNFKNILYWKGSKTSIEECVKTLLNAQNLKEEYRVEVSNSDYHVDIRIPTSMQDVELLEDLLNYILPVGYTYSIIKSTVNNSELITQLYEKSETNSSGYSSISLGEYSRDDEFMKSYNLDSYNIKNMSEVGMNVVVSAKDLENRSVDTQAISLVDESSNEEE